MRRALLALALLTLTGCTLEHVALWQAWYDQDPDAALTFAQSEQIQGELAAGIQPTRSSTAGGYGKWGPILQCESGGNWTIRTGNYEGGLQFLHSSWVAYGGRQYAEHVYDATPAEQIDIAERILADVGWQAWPTCSRRAGYR